MEIKYLWKIISDERQFKALIWLTKNEFIFLVELFWKIEGEIKDEKYEERLQNNNWKNVRRGSLSGNTKLKASEDKLFFLLYYLKSYPTFDVLWFHFWLSRSGSCQNIHKFLPILQRLLLKLWVSPKRKLRNPEDLKEAFWGDILDLIIDWTERKHFRHKKDSEQKKNYSWKKSVIQKRTQ